MNRHRLVPATLLALSVIATASACRKKPEPAPTPTVNQDSLNRERARQDSIAAAERARNDSLAREQARRDSIAAAERARTDAMNAARAAVVNAIYFDYDKSDITDASRATLDAKVPVLNANPNLRIRIAGNTDSRGSDEYNLALGQRRAAAAKRYLVQRGISADRIDLISYGEERPAAQGEEESAWSQNRRDEFEITAGGDTIVPAQQ